MDEQGVLKRFGSVKILTIEQLAELLGSSVRTARRRLGNWKAYTSINKNGRYYVLPEITRFDRDGLWKFKLVCFSRHGNLKRTIIELIKQSKAGLTAFQLTEMVGLAANSSLPSHLRNAPDVRREKHQGRFVYLASDPVIYRKQVRELAASQSEIKDFPTESEAIMILVQYIKSPGISMEELAKLLSKQGREIRPAVLSCFFEHHGLLKKTPATGS